MVTIGKKIKEERLRLGFTQESMAKAGGVSRQTQIRYEADERSPDGLYLESIAKIGADVSYIMTGDRHNATEQNPDTAIQWSFDDVMLRLKNISNAGSYAALAAMMGLSSSAYANLKKRNSLPFERVIALGNSLNVSIDWLLTGAGDARKYGYIGQSAKLMTQEQSAHYNMPPIDMKIAKMAELLDGLSDTQQQEIWTAIAEKKRINSLEQRLDQLTRKSA
jgi:transcriptional regulator with XRE-family HTH domain